MKAIFAIALQTMRSSMRSKVFLLIFIVIIAATALLPASVIGDSTLAGEFRIKINYSLGIITFLTGLAALWVGTVNISREIEGYQIHMVVTKPVTGLRLWLGKFIGITVLCLGVLYLSSTYIYWKVTSEIEGIRTELIEKSSRLIAEIRDTLPEEEKKTFFYDQDARTIDGLIRAYATEEEKEKLNTIKGESPERSTLKSRLKPLAKRLSEYDELQREVLTGSTYFKWSKPNYSEMAYQTMVARSEIKDGQQVSSEILGARSRLLESSQGNLKKRTQNSWEPKKFKFENLPEFADDDPVFFRLRIYAGDSLDQRPRNTAFFFALIDEEKKENLTGIQGPLGIRTTRFYTYPIPPQMLKGRKSITLVLLNGDHQGRRIQTGKKDPLKDLVIQAKDGPTLLVGKTSFFSNYWRCIMLIALFIAFLVIVGTAAGLCFSTPVAVLLSASYIIVGVSVSSVLSSDAQYEVEKYSGQTEANKTGSDLLKGYFRVLEQVLVSVETFSRMESLTSGKAITWPLILKVLLYDFILKGLPLVLLGLYSLRRRELGLVVRKA